MRNAGGAADLAALAALAECTLQTGLLRLEPLTAAHAAQLFPLWVDPALYRYLDSGPPARAAELEARYRRWAARQSPDGRELWLNWAVLHRAFGIIGTVQATVEVTVQEKPGPRGSAQPSAWVGYQLAQAFWGQGHATAAVRCMIEHVAGGCRVRRFLACVEQDHQKSIALLRRLGFRQAAPAQPARQGLAASERLFVASAARFRDAA